MWKLASPDRYTLLKEFALENRRHPTEAEMVFWELVRANRLGFKFTRQHIIGDYIVDFYCPTHHIVVEIDGSYHSERDQMEADAIRAAWLESIDCHVVRFSNDSILFEIEQVREQLIDYISQKCGL